MFDTMAEGPRCGDLVPDDAMDELERLLDADDDCPECTPDWVDDGALSGTLLDYGRTTYHPPAALADHVRVATTPADFPAAAAQPPTRAVGCWASQTTRRYRPK